MKKSFIVLICLLMANIVYTTEALAGEVNLLEKYPVNTPLFTQGLELNQDNELILGTGLQGQSKIGKFNLETGELEDAQLLPNNYFGEGLTHTENFLWQLTWKEKLVLKRDPKTFEILEEIPIETEGWGLCYDSENKVLWRSDGSSALYKHDPNTFELLDKVKIMNGKLSASKLNELEYYNGYIYANRLYRDEIVKIDPKEDKVVDQYDVRSIIDETMDEEQIASIDTLNGIAHIKDNEFYITGKLYPYIYKVTLD